MFDRSRRVGLKEGDVVGVGVDDAESCDAVPVGDGAVRVEPCECHTVRESCVDELLGVPKGEKIERE